MQNSSKRFNIFGDTFTFHEALFLILLPKQSVTIWHSVNPRWPPPLFGSFPKIHQIFYRQSSLKYPFDINYGESEHNHTNHSDVFYVETRSPNTYNPDILTYASTQPSLPSSKVQHVKQDRSYQNNIMSATTWRGKF